MRTMYPFRLRAGCVLVPLGALLLVVLGTACSGGTDAPEQSASEIVARAADATAAEKHFHFVFDEENGPKSTSGVHLVFAEGDVVVPDRVKADVSGTFLGFPLRSELVVAGGKTFIKDPLSGKWREVTINTNPIAFFDPAQGVVAVIKGATQLELAGSEKVDDANAYHVKGKTTVGSISPLLGNPPGTRPVDIDLWIDKETDRLVRLRLSGQVEAGDRDGAVRTIELSHFGTAVSIVAPRPGT